MVNNCSGSICFVFCVVSLVGCNFSEDSKTNGDDVFDKEMKEYRVDRPNNLLSFSVGDSIEELGDLSGEFRLKRTLKDHIEYLGGTTSSLNFECVQRARSNLGHEFRFDVSTVDTFVLNETDVDEIYSKAEKYGVFLAALEFGWLNDSILAERTTKFLKLRIPNQVVEELLPDDEIVVINTEYLLDRSGKNQWVFIFRNGKLKFNLGFRNAIFIHGPEWGVR